MSAIDPNNPAAAAAPAAPATAPATPAPAAPDPARAARLKCLCNVLRCFALIVTFSLLSAHLMVARLGFAFWAVAATLILLSSRVRALLWHSRTRALTAAAVLAVWLLAILETYFGYTGIYYGAIGTEARVPLPLDPWLVWILLGIYEYSSTLIAVGILALTLLLYMVVAPLLVKATDKAKAKAAITLGADVLAFIGAFLGIMMLFQFTNGFGVDRVGFVNARIRADAALTELGNDEPAVQQLEKDVELLKQEVEALRNKRPPDAADKFTEKTKKYFEIMRELDEAARDKNSIDRKPAYDPAPVVDQARPQRNPEIFQQPQRKPHRSMGPDDLLQIILLEDYLQRVRDKGSALGRQRAALIKEIGELVRLILFQAIQGDTSLQPLATEAADNIVRIIALLPVEDALKALDAEIERLGQELRRRRNENERRRAELDRYRADLERAERNELRCRSDLRDVADFFATDRGAALLQRIRDLRSRNPETTLQLYDWRRFDGPAIERPRRPSGEDAIAPVIENEVEQELTRTGLPAAAPPPTDMFQALNQRLGDEAMASALSGYVQRLCAAGLSGNQIIERLASRLDQAR
jgi:peptidoglycan hydrolase CwlO-like protein